MIHKVYRRDGSLWAKGKLVAGKPDGFWVWFRKDGTKLRFGYFTRGKQRGRFAMYIPPLLEAMGLAEVEHNPRGNRMRARQWDIFDFNSLT